MVQLLKLKLYRTLDGRYLPGLNIVENIVRLKCVKNIIMMT